MVKTANVFRININYNMRHFRDITRHKTVHLRQRGCRLLRIPSSTAYATDRSATTQINT